MRFWLISATLALAPFAIAGGLMAQANMGRDPEMRALVNAKARALAAERRSEALRQEASNAESTSPSVCEPVNARA